MTERMSERWCRKRDSVVLTDMANSWVGHPDASIDLAIIALAPLNAQFQARGLRPLLAILNPDNIADPALMGRLGVLEPVVMVGYPVGLWDSVNNLPIVRRGSSATPIRVDMEGEPEFMIDAACFPGSSGSPVLLYNELGYQKPDGNYVIGTRIALLGVLYAGPQHTIEGKIEVLPIPTTHGPVPVTLIPTHLGFVVKASKILDFLPFLVQAGHIGPAAPAGDPGTRR